MLHENGFEVRQSLRWSFLDTLGKIFKDKKVRRYFLVNLFIGICLIAATFFATTAYHDSQFRIIYSLDQKQNDKELVRLINDADKYVYFAIYYFTKNNIADALVAAKKRGLVVWGINDREASGDSNKKIVEELQAAGITVESQRHKEGIMHLKVLVTDKAYASGSYNWTGSATNINDEVLEIGSNKSVRNQYLRLIKKILIANQ